MSQRLVFPMNPRPANPPQAGVRPGGSGVQTPGNYPTPASPAIPQPARTIVTTPMGALYPHVAHPQWLPWEREFRSLPNRSFFASDRSPSNPYVFPIGSYEVPNDQYLLIQEYSFAAAKPSGAAATDTVPLEPERGSTLWGFDVTVNQAREARNTQFELDPVPINTGASAFEVVANGAGRTPSTSVFNRNASNSFAATSGSGRATLPFRPARYGPSRGPFTIRAMPGSIVAASCTIFRPLPFPLAYVEASLKGYLVSVLLMERFLREIQP